MQIISSNTIITNINSTKILGLIIDSSLSWKDHITGLTSKINKAFFNVLLSAHPAEIPGK
jgi:hypothetical protein